MTTGVEGSPSIDSPPMPGKEYRYHWWHGQDGKYEQFNSGRRAKWNPYTSLTKTAQTDGLWVLQCPGIPSVAPAHTLSYGLEGLGLAPMWTTMDNFPTITSSENLNRLTKLLAKIKGHSFNAAVTGSQLGELASMVTRTASSFGRSIMALKHGDFATAARCLGTSPRPSRLKPNDVGGRWLELQYGWLPSLQDIHAYAKALEAVANGPNKTRFYAVEGNHVTTYNFDNIAGLGSDSYQLRCKYGRSYCFEQYEELSLSRQLGLLDPLSVIWELAPYSFVVDWFVPIGDWLEALNQVSSLTGRWLITDFAEWSTGIKYGHEGSFGYCPYHLVPFQGAQSHPTIKCSGMLMDRFTDGPKLTFPSVKFAGAVHGTRVGNAISLLAQRFLK
jgi:hypothetical protein